MPNSNKEKYDTAFISAFEIEDTNSLPGLAYQSIDEWDSIGHMTLMSELEEAFEITIETEDLIQFESYKQGPEILSRYKVEVELC